MAGDELVVEEGVEECAEGLSDNVHGVGSEVCHIRSPVLWVEKELLRSEQVSDGQCRVMGHPSGASPVAGGCRDDAGRAPQLRDRMPSGCGKLCPLVEDAVPYGADDSTDAVGYRSSGGDKGGAGHDRATDEGNADRSGRGSSDLDAECGGYGSGDSTKTKAGDGGSHARVAG